MLGRFGNASSKVDSFKVHTYMLYCRSIALRDYNEIRPNTTKKRLLRMSELKENVNETTDEVGELDLSKMTCWRNDL